MIEFNCEHCGKELHLADNYAGRDGWCRVCKRMVIVPADGKIQHVDELPMAEGYERLQRLLQYAATKADKFKLHLAQQSQSDHREEQLEADLHAAQERLTEKEQALSMAREAERLQEQAHARKLDEAMAMVASLETALATSDTQANKRRDEEFQTLEQALSTAHAEAKARETQVSEQAQELRDLQERLATRDPESQAAQEKLASECDSLRRSLKDQESALNEANAEVERLTERLTSQISPDDSARADQEEIARLHAELSDLRSTLHSVESDRDANAKEAAEHSAEITAHQKNISQLEEEIRTQNEALGNLQARHEDRERTTREQIFALEEQVGLFDELTTRVSNLQGKVSTLDQERLDLTLRLEEAQRQQVVVTKKCESLEYRLQEATDEKAAHLVQLEDYQREGSCNEAQIRQLKDELRALTEAQRAATSERENETQRLEQKHAEIVALNTSLEDTNTLLTGQQTACSELEQRLGEQQTAYAELEKRRDEQQTAFSELELRLGEQQTARSELELRLSSADAEQARLVAQLEAADQSGGDETQAMAETRSRIEALEAELQDRQEQANNYRAEADGLKRSLADSETQIRELEAELNELEDTVTPPPPSQRAAESQDDMTESVETLFVVDPVSEVQRQQERKQMMDVLSDFLDK